MFVGWEFLGRSLVLISPFGSNDFSVFVSSLVFNKGEKEKVQRE